MTEPLNCPHCRRQAELAMDDLVPHEPVSEMPTSPAYRTARAESPKTINPMLVDDVPVPPEIL